jgi:hypothetical protein
MTYSEKLKDPRWQRRRLEVLQYYNFFCDQCGDDKTELHVHHRVYIKGREPWDYPIQMLRAVCKPCHESLTKVDQALKGSATNAIIAANVEGIKLLLAEHAMTGPGDEAFVAAIEFINFALETICPPQLAKLELHILPTPDAVNEIRARIEKALKP